MPPELLDARPERSLPDRPGSGPTEAQRLPAGDPDCSALPTMTDIDSLVAELDEIDATLAELG